MEVLESKGILFVTLVAPNEEDTALSKGDLVRQAREKVAELITTVAVDEMIVGVDGSKIQVAVKL